MFFTSSSFTSCFIKHFSSCVRVPDSVSTWAVHQPHLLPNPIPGCFFIGNPYLFFVHDLAYCFLYLCLGFLLPCSRVLLWSPQTCSYRTCHTYISTVLWTLHAVRLNLILQKWCGPFTALWSPQVSNLNQFRDSKGGSTELGHENSSIIKHFNHLSHTISW